MIWQKLQDAKTKNITYILLLFLYFCGLGSYLSSLSPYLTQSYPNGSNWLLFIGQLGYPLGYLGSGYLSDRSRRIRSLLIPGLLGLTAFQFLLYSYNSHFLWGFVFAFFSRFLLSANLQLISIAILEERGNGSFARLRSAGTSGFAVIQLLLWLLVAGGENLRLDYGWAGSTGAFFYLPCVLLAFFVPRGRHDSQAMQLIKALQSMLSQAGLLFLFGSFMYFFVFQIVENYLGAFLDRAGGRSLVFGGWFVAVLLEIPWLWVCARLAEQSKSSVLFYFALLSGILRFGGYVAWILGLPVSLWILQALHGIQFMSYHLGAIYWIRTHTPNAMYGSVSGLYYIVSQASGAVLGNLFFGQILENWQTLIIWLPWKMNSTTFTDYALVFTCATLIYVALLPLFYYLKSLQNSRTHTADRI